MFGKIVFQQLSKIPYIARYSTIKLIFTSIHICHNSLNIYNKIRPCLWHNQMVLIYNYCMHRERENEYKYTVVVIA